MVHHGSLDKCYKCKAKPYQTENIWVHEVSNRYHVCRDHIIGMEEAYKHMFATEYGGMECHSGDRFVCFKPFKPTIELRSEGLE